jgi:hypothetical protein
MPFELNGSFFSSDDWDIPKEKVMTYLKAHSSPLDSNTVDGYEPLIFF